jgi:hypothetical protein
LEIDRPSLDHPDGNVAKEKAAGHYSERLSNATAGFPVPPLDKQ